MIDPNYAEEAAVEFASHPDLYLQDIDAAADDHQASKRRTTIIADDNPWGVTMQTFMPYSDYTKTARVLDRQRLGKQRVEAWQILRALTGQSKGWVNHPATKMWRGYEAELALYAIAICEEWIKRGYKDTMLERFDDFIFNYASRDAGRPWWASSARLHKSHRSNLVRKFPEHYGPLWPDIPDDMPYVWPVP